MGKFSTLEKAELTNAWTVEERSALAHFLEQILIEKDHEINHHRPGLIFIGSGAVGINFQNEKITLKAGNTFEELSLFSSETKETQLKALEDTTLWILSPEKWEELRQISPIVSIKLLEALTKKFIDKLQKVQAQHPELTNLTLTLS